MILVRPLIEALCSAVHPSCIYMYRSIHSKLHSEDRLLFNAVRNTITQGSLLVFLQSSYHIRAFVTRDDPIPDCRVMIHQ